MPDPDAAAPVEADRVAVAFGRVLRRCGLAVPVGSTLVFARALALVGFARGDDVYWAGRATLVVRPEDVDAYDRAFAAFWGPGAHQTRGPVAVPDVTAVLEVPDAAELPDDATADDGPDGPVMRVRWSPTEVLRDLDFAAYTPAEFAEARRLVADLRLAGALRPSRRRRRTRRPTNVPDLRRTLRRSLRAGGEPLLGGYLTAGERPRRLVLLLDVSGSMEPYARAYARFLHAAVVGRGRVEAFALGTRLTRITRELGARDPDAALRAAARRVPDWAGGTRLGDGLRRFNDEWGVRGLARGAVVVIVSDGWDRGAPETIAEQMARLGRVAHRIVWVNPLKASPGYAPLAGGMAAALPYVDEFVEGHSLTALEHLADVIAR